MIYSFFTTTHIISLHITRRTFCTLTIIIIFGIRVLFIRIVIAILNFFETKRVIIKNIIFLTLETNFIFQIFNNFTIWYDNFDTLLVIVD